MEVPTGMQALLIGNHSSSEDVRQQDSVCATDWN